MPAQYAYISNTSIEVSTSIDVFTFTEVLTY